MAKEKETQLSKPGDLSSDPQNAHKMLTQQLTSVILSQQDGGGNRTISWKPEGQLARSTQPGNKGHPASSEVEEENQPL